MRIKKIGCDIYGVTNGDVVSYSDDPDDDAGISESMDEVKGAIVRGPAMIRQALPGQVRPCRGQISSQGCNPNESGTRPEAEADHPDVAEG